MKTSLGPIALLAFLLLNNAEAGTNRYDSSNYGMYQQSGKMTWLTNSASLSYQVRGCVWAVTEKNEDYGCLANSSEDGTYAWYQMANCRRAQVAYNMYGSTSSSTSCKSSTFKESYHSQDGLVGFVSTVSNYYNNNYYVSYNDVYQLPSCTQDGNSGYYLGVGCGDDGSFVIAKFSDAYCMTPVGTYDTLDNLNKKIKKMANQCESCTDSNGNNVCETLLQYSESCSPLDNAMCGDDDGSKVSTYKSSSSGGSLSSKNSKMASSLEGIGNTVKYALGSCFLLASFIMFLGILMMNRRKRRANLNRKFRQSSSKGRTRSRSRSSRSKSRSKSRERTAKADEGIYT